MRTNIGLLFGSFNPIHIGHLALANYILEYSDLSEIWFVVSPQNPFKDESELIPESLRYRMVQMAIVGEPRFKVSDIEFNLPKPSYTINTLGKLTEEYPNFNFVIIIGSDNLISLDKWKDAEKIIQSFDFMIYPRPKFLVDETLLSSKIKFINAPVFEISSTMIRKGLKENRKLRYFLSKGVYDFIIENKLYREQLSKKTKSLP